ncbi:conserved hypothetical protein [Perkinsus marinus ATCC 50983]|uniref:Saccharopine dehydrogenase NADP binding domain-containing protein n=1 Tax=Perkinsus marinus (strain ATCC 50983 / TXsc) TaxID=423536 RepID=C5LZP4_PERM5|nr:conserved hypothetical protein [Perkinsus marinus ATCC 50983]EEQ97712.1 conserved hypothetical protein [Perkinsus marinus ATCC 50983]|eukprot:XP_002764995.1 conserved hypothetical protein [Perkinsus marinus ATCC 50983]
MLNIKSTSRPVDIAVFGATGFTGSLIVAYLAYNYSQLNITLVGRDKIRLNVLARRHQNADFDVVRTPLVRVCIACGTHYCDITGETPWVARDLLLLHEKAKMNKTFIVNFCGFDSQPADLLVGFAEKILKAPLSSAEAFVSMRGTFSGGTLQSGIAMAGVPEASDLYCLGGGPSTTSSSVEVDDHPVCPSETLGCWLAPFGMASINTRVVRRTASLKGQRFSYGEALCVSDEKSAKKQTIVASPKVRQSLIEMGKLPKPGQGPDPLLRTRSWFKYVVHATSVSGANLWLQLSGGDPGYDETALMVSEAAVGLLENEGVDGHWGVVTPGYAFDPEKMIKRLRSAKLDSGLVLADGDHVGDDNEFDADFLAFRRTLLKTIKNFLAEIAAMAVRQAKRRVQEVRRRRLIHSTGEGGGSPQALVAITGQ